LGRQTILVLRTVLVALLAGSVVVQVVFVPLLYIDMRELDPDLAYVRVPLVVIAILMVLAAQAVLICVWKLVSMVRKGTVFSNDAFRYVDVIIGAVTAGAVLVLAFAVLLATTNRNVPGDAVAPGMVLLICGGSVAVFGVALVVLVLRMLLVQAVTRDAEASRMQTELDGVI
jgi:hypothetical protein